MPKLDKQELLDKAEGIEACWEADFNLETEAYRTAVMELLLENLGYNIIELWEQNKEALTALESEEEEEEEE